MEKYKTLVRLVAITLVLAINFLMIPMAESANRLTSVSDTLTRLKISTDADHTVVFTTPSAIDDDDTIEVTFPSGFDLTAPILITDVDIAGDTVGEETLAADCTGVDMMSWVLAGQVMTFTVCNGDGGDFIATETITVEVGTNAAGPGVNQIVNPGTTGIKEMTIDVKADGATLQSDAKTNIYIVTDDQVIVQATVDPVLSFSILGGMVGGTEPNAIDFGTLEPNAYHKLMGSTTAYAGIEFTANPVEDETVTVHSQAYTFKDTQAEADAQTDFVFIGNDFDDTAANLYRAINNTDGDDVRANLDPDDPSQLWIIAVTSPYGITGNDYTIVDGTGGDVTLTHDAGTFIDGQDGSNYKDSNLGYGEVDGVNVGNEAQGTFLLISTNAAGGYVITVQNTDTGDDNANGFTNGTNDINDWNASDYGYGIWAEAFSARYGAAVPASDEIIADAFDVDAAAIPGGLGTAAVTLASFTTGDVDPAYVAGDLIAIEYNVRIDAAQEAGLYYDTITYIATSTF